MTEKTGCVYAVKFKEDDKFVYVGVTRRTIRKRWAEHQTKGNSVLLQAIRIFGADAFSPIEIETVPISQLSEREQYWIARLETLWPGGLNRTQGGDGNCCSGAPAWRVEKYKSMWNAPGRRDRAREKAKEQWADPECRKKLSENMSKRAKARCADPEHRRKMSERVKALWADPDYRRKAEERRADPDYRKKYVG